MGGKVLLYKREQSAKWQCASFLEGRMRRATTKTTSLAEAKDFAEDWYLTLRGLQRRGELPNEKTFKQAAEMFTREYEVITRGERSPKWVEGHKSRLRLHLLPFFGRMGLSEITAGKAQEYRVQRLNNPPAGKKPPSYSTLHQDIVTLRLVLKAAVRHEWLKHVPDLSAPYRRSGKIAHRAWFSPAEYRMLYKATRENIRQAIGRRKVRMAEELHDKVLFLANTGIRPDEARRLEYRDVTVVKDQATNQTILEIEVRGKRGVGYCKSMGGAVQPFLRMKERSRPQPTDLLFVKDHKRQFNRILEELNLKFDRDGNRRTLYSLRHSYISFRLLEGADIYQIAKNCRTSVEMIEKHYAVHLKNHLDTAAINRRKSR
ncbi:MAG: tyrosine-type recombinase/integrase [Hyphomicrobiaceae bacterium]